MDSIVLDKHCHGCDVVRPISDFYITKGKPVSQCKICATRKGRQAYSEGRKKIPARKPVAEITQVEIERRRAYSAKHRGKEKTREYQKQYRQNNKQKLTEYNRQYRSENQQQVSTYKRNYKARKRQADGTHSAADVHKKLLQQQGKCYWCGDLLEISGLNKYQVDHIIALAIGGSNGPENICCACPTCNHGKRDRLPYQFCGRLL